MSEGIKSKLQRGEQFKTFREFEVFFDQYQKQSRQQFVKRHSKFLDSDKLDKATTDALIYYEVVYKCKFGGKHNSSSKGIRTTRTFKSECPAFIRLAVSRDRTHLEIRNFCEDHHNHSGSEEYFDYLPENRKLKEEKEKTLQLLQLKCDKKEIQDKLAKEDKKIVSRKDLHNLARLLRKDDDDTLSAAVELLEQTYGADVCVLHEEQEFKGLYFSTEMMRRDMTSFPEIVFVDGTYKLFTRNFTLMLLVVEDGNSRTKIVGVGILANEERVTVKWFFECFQKQNLESCKKINCFMSDKDLTERSVIKEVFPGIPTYICLFHTLRTFSREVALNKMNITPEERITSLTYLDKLAKSKSNNSYDRTYEEFSRNVPQVVRDYFNRNWHIIRCEWTLCNMVNGNLGNTTNNRLESLNSKIKQVIDRKSTLVVFVKSFFKFLDYRNHETTYQRVQQFLKKDVVAFEPDSDESNYKRALTSPAFAMVISEIKKSTSITFKTYDQDTMTCTIGFHDGEIAVSHLNCACPTWNSSLVPCRHIFALRKHCGLPLFDRALCLERWTRSYCMQVDPLLNIVSTQSHCNSTPATVVTTIVKPKKRTAAQKKSALCTVLNDILQTARTAPDSTFENKLSVLKQIQELWHEGFEVCVMKVGASPMHSPNKISEQFQDDPRKLACNSDSADLIGIQTNLANLSMDEEKNYGDSEASRKTKSISTPNDVEGTPMVGSGRDKHVPIETLKLPSIVKLIGRPKGALATTLGVAKKKGKPHPFMQKPADVQQREILGWVIDSKIIPNVLNKEYKVTVDDVQKWESVNISDAIVDSSVDLKIVEEYFEDSAFEKLLNLVDIKKKVCRFTCQTCERFADTECAFCDSCLHWIHFTCASLRRKPRTKIWFFPWCKQRS